MVDIMSMVQAFLNLGPALMMPVILFILALLFRQPIGKSARAAILVGVAFIGIFAVLGACLAVVGDVVKAFTTRYGLSLAGVDIGWPLTAAITWGIWLSALIIPIGFIVNILLLIPGWTKTFDADLWNYWHWAFTAAMVYMWTQNAILSLAIAIVTEILILKLADWTAPLAQVYFSIPGCSLPHTETVNWAPLNLALEKLIFSRIKSLEKVKLDPESIRAKLGYFGEPMMIGFYVGIILGLLSTTDIVTIYKLGIYLAALMLLEGRMIGILMEGLVPIADGIREYFGKTERFKGREIYIGIDAGPIGLGNPPSIAVGYIALPLIMILATLPGFKILPMADLAILPIFFMWATAASKGNLLKGFFNGLVTSLLVLYITNSYAPALTMAAQAVKYTLPAGVLLVSSLDAGGHVLPWILSMPIVYAVQGSLSDAIYPLLVGVAYFAAWYYARDMPKKLADELQKQT